MEEDRRRGRELDQRLMVLTGKTVHDGVNAVGDEPLAVEGGEGEGGNKEGGVGELIFFFHSLRHALVLADGTLVEVLKDVHLVHVAAPHLTGQVGRTACYEASQFMHPPVGVGVGVRYMRACVHVRLKERGRKREGRKERRG